MTDKVELHQAFTDADNALALAAKAVKEALEGLTHTPAATAPSAAVEPAPTASLPEPGPVATETLVAASSAS